MRTVIKKRLTIAVLLSLTALTACVQMPTEKQSVVDQRPQISFRFNNEAIVDARVMVDELDAGRLGDFQDGKASLRVLPGTHVIKVVRGATVLLNERAYLADGVVRPFIVN